MTPHHQPQTDSSITFPAAIDKGNQLLVDYTEKKIEESEFVQAIAALLQTETGARGFFVALSSSELPLADEPNSAMKSAVDKASSLGFSVLVRNLIMSTSMELTHKRNDNEKDAAGSAMVARRMHVLIDSCKNQDLIDELQAALKSLEQAVVSSKSPSDSLAKSPDGVGISSSVAAPGSDRASAYTAFLLRWKYDLEQLSSSLAAIRACLKAR